MKAKLLKEYPYKAEFHAHTLPVSGCSEVDAEGLIRLYKARGVDTIVLTNHFSPFNIKKREDVEAYLRGFREAQKCAQQNDMVVILGVELRFTENANDYLIYGIEEDDLFSLYEYIDKGLDYFCQHYKRDNILVFQAHPFRDNMTRVDTKNLDGIEAFNMHPGHNSRVALSVKYAKQSNLLICGGTDFHHVSHEGCCLIRTKKKLQTSADIVDILKKQDFVLEMFDSIILP